MSSPESPPTVIFTFIRHGESTDNLKSAWAGWKDSPLSNHGMNQAKALGKALADSKTHFHAIHASPLQRAFLTAQAVRDAQPEPQPPLTTSLLLREQHWGIAEGQPWIMEMQPGLTREEHFARKLFPVPTTRAHKFPEGESLDDLAERAKQAVDELLLPYVWSAARGGDQGLHVAVVSHGLCISELVPALLGHSRIQPDGHYRGLLNTAWARLTVKVKGAREGQPMEFKDDNPPPLEVKITEFNRHEHLDSVERQKGGIGSAAYDPSQQSIRAFFGGGTPTEEGRAASNAYDESNISIGD